MERKLLTNLHSWLSGNERKPLVLRGARQVGKTWLVRALAKSAGRVLIELNFEKQPALASLFKSNDPKKILLNLGAHLGVEIHPEASLLFLDEIQAAPDLLASLRWFAEELPQLPVITAGSLLEFTLAEHNFSMPVGRINYMHVEPLSFEEFLLAKGNSALCDYLAQYKPGDELPDILHEQLSDAFKEYVIVGGMPAVVASWVTEHSLPRVSQIQHDLLATYRDDFAKYKGRIAIERLDEVIQAVPKMLGQKFMFSRVNASVQSDAIKQVLGLLEKARLINRVWSCSANGLPLGAEMKDKYFKVVFLDCGLCSTALGLSLNQLSLGQELVLVNNGALAEQVAGQLLRGIEPAYQAPALYCWHRDEPTSNAEIDYVMQHHNQVVPLEVKAGATGGLKSLHLFMGMKKYSVAVRVNSDKPSVVAVNVKDHAGQSVQYQLLSIPFYLMGQIHRLLDLV